MKDFILEPTDKFELLRVWEASKFASPALSRQPIEMTLNQKRKSFGVESAQSLPPEMRQPPQLCFDGEPVAHRQDLAVLLNCSRLVAQYKTHQGNFVVVISVNAVRTKSPYKSPPHGSWNGGNVIWGPHVNLFNRVIALCIDADLQVFNIVSLGHGLDARRTDDKASNCGEHYLFDSVKHTNFGEDGVVISFFRGPSATLNLVPIVEDSIRSRAAGYRVPTTPFTLLDALRESPEHYIYAEWLLNDLPLNVTINPMRSAWRGIKQLLQPKLKTSDLIKLDPIDGWKDYQGGDVAAEMRAQLKI